MPPRARAQSVSRARAASSTPDAVSKVPALGKRKRTQTRSPSPSQSDPGDEPRRKRGRPAKNTPSRAASAAPSTGPSTRVPKTIVTAELLIPASHPRPARQLFIWGNGDMGQFGLGTEILGDIVRPRLHTWVENSVSEGRFGSQGAGLETICAGGMHSLIVDEAGKVWSWGINDNAALGRPTANIPDPYNPGAFIDTEVLETQPTVVQSLVDENFRAVKVAAGDSISVALGSRGELRVWGSFRSSDGLLGFDGKAGSPKTQIVPFALPTLQQYQFIGVACGVDHVLALTSTGHVYVWGNGQQAQLGRKIIERRKVNGLAPERLALRKVARVGSGSYHSFAVDQSGIVYAWGLNSMRQTGVSPDKGGKGAIVPVPTPVDNLDPKKLGGRTVVSISGGEHHTLFLLSDGSVWGCGRCDGYELGLADDHPAMKGIDARRKAAEERWKEKRAKAAAKRVREEARRARKSLLAQVTAAEKEVEDREMHGDENQEELQPDRPPPIDDFVPEPVPIVFPPPPPASISSDSSSQLEDPSIPPWNDSFYSKPPSDPVVYISAGTRHNLAVTKAGYVYSWGYSSQSALGLGKDVEASQTPKRVKSRALEGWIVEEAAAGGQHCLVAARRAGS